MKISLVRKYAALCALLLTFGTAVTLNAQSARDSFNSKSDYKSAASNIGNVWANPVKNFRPDLLKGVSSAADTYEYVGENMIARGHVVIHTGQFELTADQAVININSQDFEASGNVTFSYRTITPKQIDYIEYEQLLADVTKKVTVLSSTVSPTGRKKLNVQIEAVEGYIKTGRVSGNIRTGALDFSNFAIKTGHLFAMASKANRAPDGTLTLENTRASTCEYMMDGHDHYAITSGKTVLTPRKYDSGFGNYDADHRRHSILAYNTTLRFWDVPILWFPALYKPRETDSFGVDLAFGRSSEWGYWIRMSKGFNLWDDPTINITGLLDYYTERGVGSGGTATVITDNSRTEFFAYGISDRDPYGAWDTDDDDESKWYENNTRLKIPHGRYDVKLSNVTHLTPRLDFRGQFELLSDFEFLRDYFRGRYNENIQPPTYAALEYQNEYFSANLYSTVKVNYFDSVVQRLPDFSLDIPRVELFKGLYYQSENSAAYLSMNWRTFDRPSPYGNIDNYASGRFDSLHMFYYPINLDYINIIPRAGVRATAYTTTSRDKMSDEDLSAMFMANSDEWKLSQMYPFTNYNEASAARVRIAAEFGVEANTKLYRTWQDARSAFFGIDGLRHVAEPYINYTFIPKPTFNSEKILYFDDIDRIDEQNFIRFGAVNRLETRTGAYGSEQIREWASLETYWDFHMIRTERFNHVGDLGIKFSFTPMEGLSLTSNMLWDIGQNNDHESEAKRGQRYGGRPGLSQLKYLNMWNTTLRYQITRDWAVYGSYIYSDTYWNRAVYSMGSTMSMINASTSTLSTNYPRSQKLTFGVDFPTYIDPKLKGGVYVQYDVDAALLKQAAIYLKRNFHCFDAGVELGREETRNSEGNKSDSYYFGGFVSLSAMPSANYHSKTGIGN